MEKKNLLKGFSDFAEINNKWNDRKRIGRLCASKTNGFVSGEALGG